MSTSLSEKMSRFKGSPTSAVIARVAELKREGKDIISLNVGEPDFGTPANIKVAGIKAITDNFTCYTPGNGIAELREAIAAKLLADNSIKYSPNEIVVSVGAKQSLASAITVIAGPGDEVLIPVPCWVSYEEMVKMAGAEPVFVQVNKEDFSLDLDAVERAVTPRTKAIIICSPNNPTGAVYSEAALRRLADIAEKNDFFIISDEVYEKLIYDGNKHFSPASISDSLRNRTITINGVSKAYAMTGWRIGYAAARADVAKGIAAIQSQVTSSACSISQAAAAAALSGPQTDMALMVAEFAKRRDYVDGRLANIPGITCPKARGAFYVFPDVSAFFGKSDGRTKIENDVTLCEYLLNEALVALVPGVSFNLAGHLRISYSNSMENLEKAFDRMEKALSALR